MTKFKSVLLSIVIIGIIVASFQISLRVIKEQRNNVVEICADLDSFTDVSYKIGDSIENVSKQLRLAGVNSIAVSETNLAKLEKQGKVLLYDGNAMSYLTGNNTYISLLRMKEYIVNNNLGYQNLSVIMTREENIYKFLKNSLESRYPGLIYSVEEGQYAILIKKPLSNIKAEGLGIMEEDLVMAKTLGFTNIVPRIENYAELTLEQIDEIYDQVKRYKVRTIIFAGSQVLGYDSEDTDFEKIKYIGEKFSQEGQEIITAILEKPAETDLETVQRGINKLAYYSKYINTKVYSIDEAQLAKLSINSMVDQWGRAISQRNVRLIYLRPLNLNYKSENENFIDTLTAVSDINERIEYMGMEKGVAKALGTVKQNNILQLTIVISIICAGVYTFLYFCKQKTWMYILTGIGIITVCAIYLYNPLYERFGDLANKIFSFGAACLFPSIASIYLIEVYNKYSKVKEMKLFELIKNSIVVLLISVFISAIGGLFVGALLSDSKYILKLDTFRGVKLSFIIPLMFFVGAFILKLGIFNDKDGKPLSLWLQTNKLINTNVTVKYVIAVVVVLVGIMIVVLRSGNNLVSSVSSIELMFRNILEKYLVARPRSKELIAFPILMLVTYLANKNNKQFYFLAVVVAMIGIENVVNSFCHIRMPVLVTLLSTTYSLIFGIIVGSIIIIAVYKLIKSNILDILKK